MTDIFVVSDNILSPLGFTTAENFRRLAESGSGIRLHDHKALSADPFYAALFDKDLDAHLASVGLGPILSSASIGPDGFSAPPPAPAPSETHPGSDRIGPNGSTPSVKTPHHPSYTKFEQILIASVRQALAGTTMDPADPETILIVSSTKGNIGLLESEEPVPDWKNRIALHTSAKEVARYFHFAHPPLVVSNACISGLLAIITGMRLIRSGRYKNAVIAGADLISRFVLSGFQSFQAVSGEPCRPFDKDRTGISLGEGAATIILSCHPPPRDSSGPEIKVAGGLTGNDANHISGPSRTGLELSYIIQKVLENAGITAMDIDFISAHGTATPYNDEMEAKALSSAGLGSVPVNSLKGYYGHTLGAAGLIESIITIESMRQGRVLPTKGFRELGVTKPIRVADTLLTGTLTHCLKTASGFGGCNAAVVFSKAEN